jgi:hypothetical protein
VAQHRLPIRFVSYFCQFRSSSQDDAIVVSADQLRKLWDSLSELRSCLCERQLERTVLRPVLLPVKTAQFTRFFPSRMTSHSKTVQFNWQCIGHFRCSSLVLYPVLSNSTLLKVTCFGLKGPLTNHSSVGRYITIISEICNLTFYGCVESSYRHSSLHSSYTSEGPAEVEFRARRNWEYIWSVLMYIQDSPVSIQTTMLRI